MTTSQSPISQLRKQADQIAAKLKAAERGDKVDATFAEKIAAARQQKVFVVGIVMDDKVVKLTLPWSTIRDSSEAGLAEYVLNQMREARDPFQ